jgi:hypothetical protein
LLLRHVCVMSAICLFLAGCAPPTTLNLQKTASINRVGVITRLTEHDLKVFDHTGITNKSYLGLLGGAAPVLLSLYFPIDRPIVWVEAQYAVNKSINGSPEQIQQHIVSDMIKNLVDTTIAEKLSKKYTVTDLNKLDARSNSGNHDQYLLAQCKDAGIDTLAVINYAYGLAAYNAKQPSVTVDGDMTVYEVNSGNILLKGTIESEQDFREHRTLEEFAADHGKLFNEDMNSAINSFSYLVARKLEVW